MDSVEESEGGGARKVATPQNWRVRVCLNSSRSSFTPLVWASSCSSSADSIPLLPLSSSWGLVSVVGEIGALSLLFGTTSFSAPPSSSSRRESAKERASHDIFCFLGGRKEVTD